MTRIPRMAACFLTSLLVAGCGTSTESGDSDATTAPAAETVTEDVTDPETTSPEPSESATSTSSLVELSIGDTFTTALGNEITVHEVRVDIPFDQESDDGGAWHAIDAEYCIGDEPPDLYVFQEFTYGWVLRTAEGYVLDYPGSSYGGIVSPQLDLYEATPIAGECYRGWVLIDGPADVEVTSARIDEIDWAL